MDEVLWGWSTATMVDQVATAPRHTVPTATCGGTYVDQLRDSSSEMYG